MTTTQAPEILPPEDTPASPPKQEATTATDAQTLDAPTDAPILEEAASADVEKATQGALVTSLSQARAEQARRLEEHRTLLGQELLGLPLLAPAVRDADLSPAAALEILQGSVWTSWSGCSSQTFKLDFGYRDAEFGSYVAATLAITYEPNSRHITREALALWLTALRHERLTSGHAANLIGQTLWSLLLPAKLTVQVKPTRLQDSALWKRDGGEGSPVYDLVEETLRLALALRVPAMIERIRAQGGPDAVDLEDASARAVKLVDKLKGGAYALTGDDGLLATACHAVAFAAFLKGGIRVLGHHFEATTKSKPDGEPVQTDFVEYAFERAAQEQGDLGDAA